MKFLSKLAAFIVVLALVAALGGCGAKSYLDTRYYEGYDANAPLNVTIRSDEEWPDYRRVDFTFDGLPGEAVPTLLCTPLEGDGPFPAIVFLHGIGQKKDFLDEIATLFVKKGFAIACSDQYTRGERDLGEAGALRSALALRRRAALNVIETRRLVDVLQGRSDIAPNRIYLVGASFGAITGSTAAAFEPRIQAAVLTYGGGNLKALFSSDEIKKELGKASGVVSSLIAYLMAPSDPVRYVDQIAPRPLLMQNGTHDRLIPNQAAEALYDAAAEPKSITWYDSDHVGLDEAHTIHVLNEAIAWLLEQDAV